MNQMGSSLKNPQETSGNYRELRLEGSERNSRELRGTAENCRKLLGNCNDRASEVYFTK